MKKEARGGESKKIHVHILMHNIGIRCSSVRAARDINGEQSKPWAKLDGRSLTVEVDHCWEDIGHCMKRCSVEKKEDLHAGHLHRTFRRRALISTALCMKSSIQSVISLYLRPTTGIEKQRLSSLPSNPRVAPFVPNCMPLNCTASFLWFNFVLVSDPIFKSNTFAYKNHVASSSSGTSMMIRNFLKGKQQNPWESRDRVWSEVLFMRLRYLLITFLFLASWVFSDVSHMDPRSLMLWFRFSVSMMGGELVRLIVTGFLVENPSMMSVFKNSELYFVYGEVYKWDLFILCAYYNPHDRAIRHSALASHKYRDRCRLLSEGGRRVSRSLHRNDPNCSQVSQSNR